MTIVIEFESLAEAMTVVIEMPYPAPNGCKEREERPARGSSAISSSRAHGAECRDTHP
jgi:hypothetical protein